MRQKIGTYLLSVIFDFNRCVLSYFQMCCTSFRGKCLLNKPSTIVILPVYVCGRYVCVNVSVWISICVFVCVCMYHCMSHCVNVYVCVCVCTCLCVCLNVCTYYVYAYIFVCMRVCLCKSVNECMCNSVCKCRVCVRMCASVFAIDFVYQCMCPYMCDASLVYVFKLRNAVEGHQFLQKAPFGDQHVEIISHFSIINLNFKFLCTCNHKV